MSKIRCLLGRHVWCAFEWRSDEVTVRVEICGRCNKTKLRRLRVVQRVEVL